MELEKQEGSRGEKRESGQAEELIELEGEEAAEMDRETALELDEKTADIIKLQFSDLCGRLKSVEIPGRAEPGWERLEAVEAEAVTGETEERPELGEGRKRGSKRREMVFLKPEWDTWLPMSWETGTGDAARVICQVTDREGSPMWSDSREVLKRELLRQERRGRTFQFAFGCEFFLFHTDEEGRATTVTHETAGYCDGGTIDLAESVRRDMLLGLEEAGIQVEYVTHGCAPGQHVFRLKARRGVQAADELLAFRAIIRRTAKSHGLHASFMPKPLNGFGGSGLEIEVLPELIQKSQGEEKERKALCLEAAERLRQSLGEMALLTNPLVNSYRRLAALREEGADREDFVRSSATGLQFFLADSSVNPYLALAAVLAAGFGEQEERTKIQKDIKRQELPSTLGEAVSVFSESAGMRKLLGERLFSFYAEMKLKEWKRHISWVSDWELREYLSRY